MDFNPTPQVTELLERVRAFMDEHVYPNEAEAIRALDDEIKPGVAYPKLLIEIRDKAKDEGLWNLFMPDERYGAGLKNWEYGILCEEMGRSPIARADGLQLLGARHRQLGDPRRARHRRAEGAVAPAAARGHDPQLLLDDRARRLRAPTRPSSRPAPSSTAASG